MTVAALNGKADRPSEWTVSSLTLPPIRQSHVTELAYVKPNLLTEANEELVEQEVEVIDELSEADSNVAVT